MRRIVTFHYTLRDPAGRVVDASAGREPVTYLEGAGQIIDGLDQRLRPAEVGAKLTVQVPAAEAYGAPDPAQVQRVKRALLPVAGELRWYLDIIDGKLITPSDIKQLLRVIQGRGV